MVSHTPSSTHGLYRRVKCSDQGVVKRDNVCYVEDKAFQIDQRAPTFGKIKLALSACVGRKGYWLLWSDADAMIVNQTLPLTHLIDDRYDLAITADWLMINAGVILFKCSKWTVGFLKRVYAAREFDTARALDQSAFQHFFNSEPDIKQHVKYIPKWTMNVYTEEYRPGDFLLHMAGKLYEATVPGAIAVAHQFDILSTMDDRDDIEAFFRTQYLLGTYSGQCIQDTNEARDSECKPQDDRRRRLKEALILMSSPSRYRHVALRYYWMPDWKDTYDTEDWNRNSEAFDSQKALSAGRDYDEATELAELGGAVEDADEQREEDVSHDEL
ncbi:Glycosyltransferase 34 [Gracilaria domingensis]|nr:Glycosyltransferase 34 [Gracilaria domingensis]